MIELKSNVKIVGMNQAGEQIAASAAKISTTSGNAIETFNESLNIDKNRKLIKKVLKSGHKSLIEHIVFNIAFSNVSAVVEQFMIEFRLASFTIKSRRYVDFSEAGYYIPEMGSDLYEQYCNHVNFLFKEYNLLLQMGIPKEDARFILPYCFYSNFYCTVNARELLHILNRIFYKNESILPEFQNIGVQLLNQLKDICPIIYDYFNDCKEDISCIETGAKRLIQGAKSNGRVELINHPQNPGILLEMTFETRKMSSIQTREAIIATIIKDQRPRELEHLVYTFKLNELTLSALTHIVRHRMQSISIPPLMYLDHDKYIIPKTILTQNSIKEKYVAIFEKNIEFIRQLKADKKVSHEITTYLGLSGNTLNIVSSMNARELLLFFKLRTCNRAQWEIKELATELLFKLRNISPEIFCHMGPSCFCEGKCPEGHLTCGKIEDVIHSFGKTDEVPDETRVET